MKQLLALLLLLCSVNILAQDVIVKKDGSTILSKVLEVSSTEVKYKKYTNMDGPIYSISFSDILTVNYENGDKEEFEHSVEKFTNFSKQRVLKAGTEIPIQIVSPVKAADVKVGQTIPFKVNRDVSVNGVTVLPYGTPVKGIVYKANKSSWWGTKGKLGIRIDGIELSNGGRIPLSNGDVYVTGTNRTALSVVLFLFVTIPACAICGSKAQIPVGYEVLANVANDVIFDMDGNITNNNDLTKQSYSYQHSLPCEATIVKYEGKSTNAIVISIDNGVITYIDKDRKGSMKNEKVRMPMIQVREIHYK